MATRLEPEMPPGAYGGDVAAQRPQWRMRSRLSSMADGMEAFLGRAGFDRGPWLTIAFGGGITCWFALDGPAEWIAMMACCAVLALGALALWKGEAARTRLTTAAVVIGVLMAAGVAAIWLRSEMVGAPAIERPMSAKLTGRILERIDQPAEDRVRLVLATRHPDTAEPIKVRVNMPLEQDRPEMTEGAVLRLTARLMPPAPPMLPGAYDFARAAYFKGYAATGSVQGEVELVDVAHGDGSLLASLQRSLSAHVRSQLGGSAGTIAAAYASGDRGAIAVADEVAMRDSGLTHLLSISGLHVSAVIAAAYLLAIRLLALWPWLTLNVRLPVIAASIAAVTGIGYTLLTGAEVPTVRSCVGAVLVLIALALGREPLSLRMVAVAAFVVLLLWPESLIGPSFQMSFAAVIAIVALSGSSPVRAYLRSREEAWWMRVWRSMVMLLVTGIVIEISLTPIVLFHFHRSGLYGALANVVAIPLTTFVSMPMIALALLFDLVSLGAPFWWLAGKSLDFMLWIAHFTAGQPGAVRLMPQMSYATFALFVAGGLWLALWRGRERLLGFVPVGVATIMLLATPVPDLLISGDGRHVAITGEGERLLVLRVSRSDFTRDNLTELAGISTEPMALADWPGARCSADFCSMTLRRGGRDWNVLMSRSNEYVPYDVLEEACAAADIVVSDRGLPRTCEPRWLKADRRMLRETGGLAINLAKSRYQTVADSQGAHGWWRSERADGPPYR